VNASAVSSANRHEMRGWGEEDGAANAAAQRSRRGAAGSTRVTLHTAGVSARALGAKSAESEFFQGGGEPLSIGALA
jgi:hypothetical protein